MDQTRIFPKESSELIRAHCVFLKIGLTNALEGSPWLGNTKRNKKRAIINKHQRAAVEHRKYVPQFSFPKIPSFIMVTLIPICLSLSIFGSITEAVLNSHAPGPSPNRSEISKNLLI